MRAGGTRGAAHGGVLVRRPSSHTGLHAASHIRCEHALIACLGAPREAKSGVETGTLHALPKYSQHSSNEHSVYCHMCTHGVS